MCKSYVVACLCEGERFRINRIRRRRLHARRMNSLRRLRI